jgi:hypothetical protein
MVDWL